MDIAANSLRASQLTDFFDLMVGKMLGLTKQGSKFVVACLLLVHSSKVVAL